MIGFYTFDKKIMKGEYMPVKIDHVRGRSLIGRSIVSKETGRKKGEIGNFSFIVESGELMNIAVVEPTQHIRDLDLQKDEKGRLLIPFTAVKSVGDFVIISEKEIV